ncbi:high frequency lysogenization protein HflD [Orbus sturtevantii]|uniref:high frequency lysogenization protein HflD n=1 Tax=Orbus sturtevantii TaxID=3074109 RepID=UPI00370DAC8A
MDNKYDHIAIALGGVCQSAILVANLANTGQCNLPLYDIALKSIFNTSPQSTADVFDGTGNIKNGLQFLTQLLNNNPEKVEIMRYILGSIGVTSKLIKDKSALAKIANRLERIQSLYGVINHETLDNHRNEISYPLAEIYSDIISPLTSKIRVTGKMEYLQNALIQAKVRAALFASVRAAILWYQVGGNRLQLLFSRKNIINAADNILQQMHNNS